MLPRIFKKVRKFIRKHKAFIKNAIIVTIIVIVILALYKMLFYSTAETSVYGVRLNEMKGNELTTKDVNSISEEASKIEGINKVSVTRKGRLIKFFITLPKETDKETAKAKINDMLGLLKDNIKNYYDITFYVKQEQEEEEKYVMIGYKHKSSDVVTYDEF